MGNLLLDWRRLGLLGNDGLHIFLSFNFLGGLDRHNHLLIVMLLGFFLDNGFLGVFGSDRGLLGGSFGRLILLGDFELGLLYLGSFLGGGLRLRFGFRLGLRLSDDVGLGLVKLGCKL